MSACVEWGYDTAFLGGVMVGGQELFGCFCVVLSNLSLFLLSRHRRLCLACVSCELILVLSKDEERGQLQKKKEV